MKIDGQAYRTIWTTPDGQAIEVIDQTVLPHRFVIKRITGLDDAFDAIRTMVVRGAPLIGATGAYGLALALARDPSDHGLDSAHRRLAGARPTAVNLRHALDDVRSHVVRLPAAERARAAFARAASICDEDVESCRRIGEAGLPLIEEIHRRKGGPVNVLTHCNAGWLATVDWGTATAPIYKAHEAGIPVHIWVDETRPRNQGASLTAWELGQHGVPHHIIVDNAGGHLMQHGEVDLVVVGADRVTARGDAANKIGTYLKALAARANRVPFYVALPQTTIDWTIEDGIRDIEIEERDATEVTHIVGRLDNGEIARVAIGAPDSPARNPAFDVTPAELITGLITDRGVCPATHEGLVGLFPERKAA